MRYISEFYPITYAEYTFETKSEGKEPDPTITPEYLEQVEKDCEKYKKHIVEAIKEAREYYIEHHLDKNILYSRTWR
mgnify:CR=1 FL=1